jgi:retron-type reverse transcriptase
MTLLTLGARKKFQPPVTERHLEAEIAHCVGGVVSPLLANVYLHYVFDWWVRQWRSRQARGDVIVVRFADLCRRRHKSAYAEARVMPTRLSDALASKRFVVSGSA